MGDKSKEVVRIERSACILPVTLHALEPVVCPKPPYTPDTARELLYAARLSGLLAKFEANPPESPYELQEALIAMACEVYFDQRVEFIGEYPEEQTDEDHA